MNRRTFTKLIGATTLSLTTPLMAKTPKLQWISAETELPKAGQRIIFLSQQAYYHGASTIIVGTFVKTTLVTMPKMGRIQFAVNQQFRIHRDVFRNNKVRWIYPKTNPKEIENCEWMKAEVNRSVGRHATNVVCSTLKGIHWIPITEIPKELPTFPKDDRPINKYSEEKYNLPGNRGRWFNYLFSENK